MKSVAIIFIALFTTSFGADAGDSCATLMCMSGKLVGASTGKSCAGPMADYFKIVRFDRHGYSENKTKNARQACLDSCSSETTGEGKRINDKFGTMRVGS
ncbi:hypothetical protein FHY18_000593 [Xanthomonas arboricola]|uniref:hypothetical protein n=1 Tax=Xanthomonas sp. 3793 TaxID=3035312 RepID=UPI00216A2425|nr:hypothetical protein [Xanthomonas sp. 3793]MCS3745063.1 hypothetical protein [Xanthomonas sp. 3793]